MTTKTKWKSTIGNVRTYQGGIVHVVSESEFWNEAKVCFVNPQGKQPTGIFTVGLPRLKKLGKNQKIGLDKSHHLWYNAIMKNTANKVYTITHLRKLSPNSKAYKASMKRTSLTGNPDIYQATTKMMPKKDQKKIIYS